MPKTWIFDLDGTLVEHNGYLKGEDKLLPNVKDFFIKIEEMDYIIILTARSDEYATQTTDFLKMQKIRFNKIIFNMPVGERILINDEKPKGLHTAIAINIKRNEGLNCNIVIDKSI